KKRTHGGGQIPFGGLVVKCRNRFFILRRGRGSCVTRSRSQGNRCAKNRDRHRCSLHYAHHSLLTVCRTCNCITLRGQPADFQKARSDSAHQGKCTTAMRMRSRRVGSRTLSLLRLSTWLLAMK